MAPFYRSSENPDRVGKSLVRPSVLSQVGLFAMLGLLLFFFVKEWTPQKSFTVELFGFEILSVEMEDDSLSPHAEERVIIRERVIDGGCGVPDLPPPPPTLHAAGEGHLPPAPEVFVVVEEMPELVGGLSAIRQSIRYPVQAKEAGLEGRVIVQFVVNETGRVCEPNVVRGVHPWLDAEAIRVVSEATFRPGKQRGKPVKVKMSIPITFRLFDEPVLDRNP